MDPIDAICRVCLSQNEPLKSIFTEENFSEHMLQVKEVMITCASVQVEIDDGLPQEICTECLRRLSEAYAFRNLCEQTDFTLRNNLVLIVKSGENEDEDLEQVNIADTNEVEENTAEVIDFTERMDDFDVAAEVEHGDTSSYENKNFKVIKMYNNQQGIYKCKVCSKQLTSRAALSRHNKLHLNIKPYECDICNQRYPIKHDMIIHKRTHSEVRPYICDVCGRGFNYSSNLCQHKKNFHGPVKLHQCQVCKQFFSNEDLEQHLTTHTEADKSHQCDDCGKCFYNTSKLKRHLKTHVGSACFICRKYFPDKASLEQHRSTHTDADKKHQCSECGLRFYTRSKLMRHAGTHTGQKKPHGCLICDKRFRDSYNLRQHMKIHTGEKDFECDVCGKLFAVNTALTKHKKQHI